mmetsp:Transcript_99941/g.177329  ORF Transcript_99941/g.177329 Transcript_99941/m.177329 type:complete len:304 (-) Transcript_99941:42-953(-)
MAAFAENPLRGAAADPARYSFETFEVTWPAENVLNIAMNRPRKLNAQDQLLWKELKLAFDAASSDPDCRVVLLTGNGRMFTSGIDLQASFLAPKAPADDQVKATQPKPDRTDVARAAMHQFTDILQTQALFNAIEECRVPVIACIHRACLGAGVDMVCAADMRYCTDDAVFAVKEVKLGIAADVGTLQRMPKVMGSESLMRELAYTGRDFTAAEAKEHGFVSRTFPDRASLCDYALETAKVIAANSPVAVAGTKHNLIYSRDHSVEDGLKHEATWNMVMLKTEDIPRAAAGFMRKKPANFSKL